MSLDSLSALVSDTSNLKYLNLGKNMVSLKKFFFIQFSYKILLLVYEVLLKMNTLKYFFFLF